MTEEQHRIVAIAETCGWKWNRFWSGELHGKPIGEQGPFRDLPDYLNDLNAMHEAEETLMHDDPNAYVCYSRDLYEQYGNTVHLTAAQRAEAYLKTIVKWEAQ
jgi:hypothetical protein